VTFGSFTEEEEQLRKQQQLQEEEEEEEERRRKEAERAEEQMKYDAIEAAAEAERAAERARILAAREPGEFHPWGAHISINPWYIAQPQPRHAPVTVEELVPGASEADAGATSAGGVGKGVNEPASHTAAASGSGLVRPALSLPSPIVTSSDSVGPSFPSLFGPVDGVSPNFALQQQQRWTFSPTTGTGTGTSPGAGTPQARTNGTTLATSNSTRKVPGSLSIPSSAPSSVPPTPTGPTTNSRSYRTETVVQELFEREAVGVPFAVMSRRDAERATKDETLARSSKQYIRQSVEQRAAKFQHTSS
jgi:hypothetical protein